MIQFRLPFQRLNVQQLIKHKDLRFEIHPVMEFSPLLKLSNKSILFHKFHVSVEQ